MGGGVPFSEASYHAKIAFSAPMNGTTKPHLLAVSPVPLPDECNGFSLRATHLVRELSRWWRITLVAPAAGAGQETALPIDNFVPVRLLGAWTFSPADYREPLREAVDEALSGASPTVALLWSGTEFLALDKKEFPPAVGDRIDCMTLIAWRNALSPGPVGQRLRALRDAVAYARDERRIVRELVATVVVGPDDATALRRISGRHTVHVVGNGVVLGRPSRADDKALQPTVVFSGTLTYPPNVDAARYFVNSIWGEVVKAVPDARLIIAGRNPVQEVYALAGSAGVEILAEVPDMAEVLRTAWVAVAPMRTGAGIKNKVLEAWAVGTPVVMTHLATNGLLLDNDAASLVADDPVVLAQLVARLLRDKEKRSRLGMSGYTLAAKKHRWVNMAAELSAVLEHASGRRVGNETAAFAAEMAR